MKFSTNEPKFVLFVFLFTILLYFSNGSLSFFTKLLSLEGSINDYTYFIIVENTSKIIGQEYEVSNYQNSSNSNETEYSFNMLLWFQISILNIRNLPKLNSKLTRSYRNRQKIIFILPETQDSFDYALNWVEYFIFEGDPSQTSLLNLIYYLQWPDILQSENQIDQNYLTEIAHNFGLDSNFFLTFRVLKDESLDISEYSNEEVPDEEIKFVIWEMYSYKNVVFTKRLDFDPETMPYDNFTMISKRRDNLTGITLKAIGIESPMEPEILSFKGPRPTGFSIYILNDLAELLKFDFVTIKHKFDVWHKGFFRPMPSVKLGLQKLYDGEVDITASFIYMFWGAAGNASALTPVRSFRLYAFFRQPPASNIRDIYINAFKADLWSVYGATWFLMLASLVIFIVVENYMILGENWAVSESFLCSLAIVCQQSWYKSPETIPKRILFLASFITGLVGYFAFSAAIISILTYEKPLIQTEEDLRNSDFKILANPWERFLYHYIKAGTIDEYRKILKLSHKYFEYGEENLVNSILNEESAVLSTKSRVGNSLRWIYKNQSMENLEKFSCDNIFEIPLNILNANGFYVKKFSPLKEILNFNILLIRERGLVERYNTNVTRETNVECLPKQIYRQFLGLKDVFTAFGILLGGYLLSSIILGIEIGLWRMKTNKVMSILPYPSEFFTEKNLYFSAKGEKFRKD